MWHNHTFIRLLLFLSYSLPFSQSISCFSNPLPLVLGGTLNDTKFTTIDIDFTGNIVIGG